MLFNVTRWPSILVFLIAGAAAALFAFVTVNLFSQAMASLAFLREFGPEAVRHGALWQVGELTLWGVVSLTCWMALVPVRASWWVGNRGGRDDPERLNQSAGHSETQRAIRARRCSCRLGSWPCLRPL